MRSPPAHLAEIPPPDDRTSGETIVALPHNPDAERSVLAAVLLDNRALSMVASDVAAETFYAESHRKIWRSMKRLHASGSPIDLLSLADDLQAHQALDAVGGPGYLAALSQHLVSAANVEHHAKIVADHHRRRRYLALADRLKEQAQALAPVDELASMVSTTQTSVSEELGRTGYTGLKSSFPELVLAMERDEDDTTAVIPTGLDWWDRLTDGGQRPGAITYLGALEKMGKSKIALTVARAMAASGWVVDWHSGEMDENELALRNLSAETGLDESHLKDYRRRREWRGEWEKLTQAAVRVSRWPGEIHVQMSDLDVEQIALQTITRAGAYGPKYAVVVDYLQMCRLRGRGRMSQYERITECANALRELAKRTRVPILIVYQVLHSKIAGRREADRLDHYPTPRAGDMSGSKQGLADANSLIVLNRPYRDEEDSSHQFTELKRLLGRGGGQEVVHLRADLGCNQFEEWTGETPRAFMKPQELPY